MFYESRVTNPTKVFRVLSCVIYSIIDNYIYIDYICCQYKKLIVMCSDKIFASTSYNKLLGIVITEVLMNLIPCHGFMKKKHQLPYYYAILGWWNTIYKKGLLLFNTTLRT